MHVGTCPAFESHSPRVFVRFVLTRDQYIRALGRGIEDGKGRRESGDVCDKMVGAQLQSWKMRWHLQLGKIAFRDIESSASAVTATNDTDHNLQNNPSEQVSQD